MTPSKGEASSLLLSVDARVHESTPYADPMIEPSMALFGEAYEKIDAEIENLLAQTGIRYGLLVDRKGFVLSHKEAKWAPRAPAMDSMATLIASNAAATNALANLLGEHTFTEQTHQGENGTLYVESVGTEALLSLVFDSSVAIGKVKVYATRAIGRIAIILDEVAALPKPELGTDFSKGASALLDELLG